jgi:hypothetical protein
VYQAKRLSTGQLPLASTSRHRARGDKIRQLFFAKPCTPRPVQPLGDGTLLKKEDSGKYLYRVGIGDTFLIVLDAQKLPLVILGVLKEYGQKLCAERAPRGINKGDHFILVPQSLGQITGIVYDCAFIIGAHRILPLPKEKT